MNSKRIEKLLSTIERDLSDYIPIAVKDMGIHVPAYCLFVWYQDFSSEFTPHFGIATQKLLDSAQTAKFADPLDKYDLIWRPQQVADLSIPDQLFLDECDIVENEVEDCYEMLAEASGILGDDDVSSLGTNDDEDFDLDEELALEFESLAPFREMMHRVGSNLRRLDWTKIMPITDHFVVLIGDYMGHWLGEDFEQCVDEQQMANLIQSGMLLPTTTD